MIWAAIVIWSRMATRQRTSLVWVGDEVHWPTRWSADELRRAPPSKRLVPGYGQLQGLVPGPVDPVDPAAPIRLPDRAAGVSRVMRRRPGATGVVPSQLWRVVRWLKHL
jgi:hypothetical protein